MCTVSFVNANGKVIITSNRDEQVIRPSALPPKEYLLNHKKVVFPKDQKAGGTWFAVNENGTIVVLLNGADEIHSRQTAYRKSRGLIVLDVIGHDSPIEFWATLDLENIEPFTLVLFQKGTLYQLRWNGISKQNNTLDAKQNHIWSSTTLYPKVIREERSAWFCDFLNANASIDEDSMLRFHRYTEEHNAENGLVVNRNEMLKTLSITQSVIESNKVILKHFDLLESKEYATSLTVI